MLAIPTGFAVFFIARWIVRLYDRPAMRPAQPRRTHCSGPDVPRSFDAKQR